jgi:hypothetical protein
MLRDKDFTKETIILEGDNLLSFLLPLYQGFEGSFYVKDNELLYEDSKRLYRLRIETIFFGPASLKEMGTIDTIELHLDENTSTLEFHLRHTRSNGYLWDRDTFCNGKLNLYEFEITEFSMSRQLFKLR